MPRILILEDDERVRTELVLCLSQEGFDCLACRTAEQALRLAEQYHDIAVGIIDIRLPGQSGLDFIAKVRDRDATYMPMRFIVVSGRVEIDTAMQAVRLKIDDLLSKPVDPATLIASVKRSLADVSVELVGRGVAAVLAEEASTNRSPQKIRASEQERHADLVENFLGLVSHELRTPLVPIIGFADMLIENGSEEPGTCQALETIRTEAVKLLERIDSILDLSQLLTGVTQPKSVPSNPIPLLEMVRNNFAGAARSRSIRIDVHLLDAPTEATIDRTMWVQAVAHVLRNALEHAKPGSTISVRLQEVGSELHCAIHNRGIPMDAALQWRATEPFRQGSEGTTRAKGGLGLGLSLARRYMELHGGSLSIESDSTESDTGTTIVLSLPLVPGHTAHG